jgi:glycosyltransferase involved in cell wall biosynthesis
LLRRVISSIAEQKVKPELLSVLLVDNGSKMPLETDLLAPIARKGIECRAVKEKIIGISRARVRAIQETAGEWICSLMMTMN